MIATVTDSGLRVYRSRRRQWLMASALVLALAVGWASILYPDPVTHTVAGPGEYLWEVVPGVILVLVLAGRGLRSRLVTSRRGLLATRVTGRDWLPWSRVRRFEVRKMAGGRAAAVVARLDDERVVRLWSYPAVRKEGGRSD
ncbi:MAG TPA: hypothetical protein VF954_04935, partial [Acidimicrobiales bacterium]